MDSAYTQGKTLTGLLSFPGPQLGGEIDGLFFGLSGGGGFLLKKFPRSSWS
jgi:hypothetical protein